MGGAWSRAGFSLGTLLGFVNLNDITRERNVFVYRISNLATKAVQAVALIRILNGMRRGVAAWAPLASSSSPQRVFQLPLFRLRLLVHKLS